MSNQPEFEQACSHDGVLTAVANDHRRAVLRSLSQTDETWMAVDTLVDRVSEQTRNGTRPDHQHRQRVRVELHHTHLPKLKEHGMIAYDTDTDRVRNTTGKLGQELLALIGQYKSHE